MNRPKQFQIDLMAEPYLNVLARLHALLGPQTYLEIGSRTGDSFKLAKCNSIAVDPGFRITDDIIGTKPACHLYQTTSDRFFERVDILGVIGGSVELAFLDGMHLAEFLLRDFLNTEQVCKRNSIVVLHDCMPSDISITCRHEGDPSRSQSKYPEWWTGDVWKTVWALKKYRPDLTILAIDTPPTGLICVTNLSPSSTILSMNYGSIVADMAALDNSNDVLFEHITSMSPIKPSRIATMEQVAEFFYL